MCIDSIHLSKSFSLEFQNKRIENMQFLHPKLSIEKHVVTLKWTATAVVYMHSERHLWVIIWTVEIGPLA